MGRELYEEGGAEGKDDAAGSAGTGCASIWRQASPAQAPRDFARAGEETAGSSAYLEPVLAFFCSRGRRRPYELHWYEHPGIGRVEMKRKQVEP